jgi:hypothetical protein
LGLSAAGALGEVDAGGSVALNATIGYTFYAGNILR